MAGPEDQAQEALNVFDRSEMVYIISMLGKTGMAVSDGEFTNDIDKHVAHGMLNSSIEPAKFNGLI